MTLKRLKRWSFAIILAITGIIYCGIDRDLLKTMQWESLIPTVEGRPQEENGFNSVPEDPVLNETAGGQDRLKGQGRFTEADQSGGAASLEGTDQFAAGQESQGEEPGQDALEDPNAADAQEPGQADPGNIPGEEVPAEPEPEIVIGRVEENYFADALFLGDSRTVGLGQYGSLRDIATFYASTGMTIYKLLGAEIVEMPEQQGKITVEEALQQQTFGKVYIMMGINEVGSGTAESFAKAYQEVIARIQELQPDAIIYIEGILRVTTARSDKGDYINNEAINTRNEAISQLADGEKIFYLDVNQAVCDEDGGLVKDYTSDGVHLKAKYLTLWEEYLKDNAVWIDGEPMPSPDPAEPMEPALSGQVESPESEPPGQAESPESELPGPAESMEFAE